MGYSVEALEVELEVVIRRSIELEGRGEVSVAPEWIQMDPSCQLVRRERGDGPWVVLYQST